MHAKAWRAKGSQDGPKHVIGAGAAVTRRLLGGYKAFFFRTGPRGLPERAERRGAAPLEPRRPTPLRGVHQFKKRDDSQVPRAPQRRGHVLATYWPMRRQYAYYTRIWIGRVTYRATRSLRRAIRVARANEWRIRIVAGGVSWPGAYRGQGLMVAVVAVVAMVARCADANRPGAGRAFRAPGALSSGRRQIAGSVRVANIARVSVWRVAYRCGESRIGVAS